MGGCSIDADQSSQSWMCRSVPHSPARITRILTSPGPGVGSGMSRSSSPGPAYGFINARMCDSLQPAEPGGLDPQFEAALRAGALVELIECAAHRSHRQFESMGDGVVLHALGEQGEDVVLDRGESHPGAGPGPGARPSAVAHDILTLLAQGMKDDAIAHRLELSVRTVRRALNQLYERTGSESRFELGVKATRFGWL